MKEMCKYEFMNIYDGKVLEMVLFRFRRIMMSQKSRTGVWPARRVF